MPGIEPFEEHTSDYEEWFKTNRWVYLSEIEAVRRSYPKRGIGIEIGVGSGRFAEPLGIKIGVEPSKEMGKLARERGIDVVEGVAENLPFEDSSFDHALMVTTICFVDDIDSAFSEAFRVLEPSGSLIVGFVDSESPLGRSYLEHKDESVFYRDATFYSVDEVVNSLRKAGFRTFIYTQTIFRDLSEIDDIEPVKDGFGEGSFVVIRAEK
ncbi:MAG: methyltransferase domain-containing protein [Candidatus Thermoplasmatota archaeon]|nr:methyltransferase domain-containing protein [Candidatus Thermoplasmatota archaeon]